MKREQVKVGQVVWDRWAGEKAEVVRPVNKSGFCWIRHIDDIYSTKSALIQCEIFWIREA